MPALMPLPSREFNVAHFMEDGHNADRSYPANLFVDPDAVRFLRLVKHFGNPKAASSSIEEHGKILG